MWLRGGRRGRRARDFCAGTATPPPTRAPFQGRMRSWARPQPRVLDPALRWLVSEVGLSWPRRPLPATTGAGRCCESCPPGKEVALGCLFWLRANRRRAGGRRPGVRRAGLGSLADLVAAAGLGEGSAPKGPGPRRGDGSASRKEGARPRWGGAQRPRRPGTPRTGWAQHLGSWRRA